LALSQAQFVPYTCPHCGEIVNVEQWLLIDLQERPDLLERLRHNRLYEFACTHCNYAYATNQANTPLLLYRFSEREPLIFSPSPWLTTEQTVTWLNWLLDTLRQRLGDAWQEQWRQCMVAVPRDELIVAFGHFEVGSRIDDLNILAPPIIVDKRARIQELERQYGNTLKDAVTAWEQLLTDPAFVLATEVFQQSLLQKAGQAFLHYYELVDRPEDYALALRLWESMLAHLPEDLSHPPAIFVQLAEALQKLYQRAEQTTLPELPHTYQITLPPPQASNSPEVFTSLGLILYERYGRTSRLDDLRNGIKIYQEVVKRLPQDSPDLPIHLTSLGNGLHAHYLHTRQIASLDKALEAFGQTLALIPANSPYISTCWTHLGNSLLQHYYYTQNEEDLMKTFAAFQAALDNVAPDSPETALYLNNKGIALQARYEQKGEMQDLADAIACYRAAVAGSTEDSPYLANNLNSLGTGLQMLYQHEKQMEILQEAIKVYADAVAHAEQNSDYLNNLGDALMILYALSGKFSDLEAAITHKRKAVAYTPIDSVQLPTRLTNLGNCLFDYYKRAGQLESLDESIRVQRDALSRMPAQIPNANLAVILSNLSAVLLDRYMRLGRLPDLEEALQLLQRAQISLPAHSPYAPLILNNIASVLLTRYGHTQQRENLSEALEKARQAEKSLPIEAPERPNLLSVLGRSLQARFFLTGLSEDIDGTIEAFKEAVALTPSHSSSLPGYLYNLAYSLSVRYNQTGQAADLQEAIDTYEETCRKGAQFALGIALAAASTWGNWASARKQWDEAATAYQYGIQAMTLLYRTQLLRISQETWLSEARGLHAKAAYALAHSAQLREAIVTLERGRARVLGETLARDHADLERIHRDYPEIYGQFQEATERMRQFEQRERTEQVLAIESKVAGSSPYEQVGEAHRHLEKAIERIQEIPEYENFLAEASYQDIVSVALPDVPLVYMATTQEGSLVLLVRASGADPELITLDSFAERDLEALLVKRSEETIIGGYLPGQFYNVQFLREALAEVQFQLGTRLIEPIAHCLLELEARGVVLVPSGLLGLLPLHAATYQWNGQGTSLLNQFEIAYAPSARVLTTVQREFQVRQSHVPGFIGVANPSPGLAQGTWARRILQSTIPQLQEAINTYTAQIQAGTASTEEQIRNQSFIAELEKIVLRLQQLSSASAETLINAGKDFLQAVEMFLSLPDLPKTALNALLDLAARIPPSLTYARAELESVQSQIASGIIATLYEEEATQAHLWDSLPQATIVHCACHGYFSSEKPLDSALLLASETRLTLRDLLNADPYRLSRLQLAFLSACQTAISDAQRLPDEAMGLFAGFLQAGVPSVIGTLWSVDDLSTTLLVNRFYERYLHADPAFHSPASLLREAQHWLRTITNYDLLAYLGDATRTQYLSPKVTTLLRPKLRKAIKNGNGDVCRYADPYYWAAFVYYGAVR